jgi:ribosomal protein S18 acetylase RimI-like enzyme
LSDTSRHGLYAAPTLSEAELADLRALAGACERHEPIDLRILWEALESRSGEETGDFLYYADGRLVGLLTLDGLGDDEAEGTGMVHPDYRRRGIFRELVGAGRAACERAGTPALLLTADRRSAGARGFAASVGAELQFAEHRMRIGPPAPAVPASDLAIARAGAADAPDIARIIADDTGLDASNFAQHVADNMRRQSHRYYIARLGGAPAGTLNIQILSGDAYVYGFVVAAELRGRGYGRQILARAIADLIEEHHGQPVLLEVETENTPALGLYRSLGFVETHTFDYYRVASAES